jgi:hypothetical protein
VIALAEANMKYIEQAQDRDQWQVTRSVELSAILCENQNKSFCLLSDLRYL